MKPNFLIPALAAPVWLTAFRRSLQNFDFPDRTSRLRLAIRLAELNVDHGGGPFGAVVFAPESDRPLGLGVNCVLASGFSHAHAEIVAIANAQFLSGKRSLSGCELFSSCEPCAMCAGAVLWSSISVLCFASPGDAARRTGFDEGDKIPDWRLAFEKRGIRVYGPLLEAEAERPFDCFRAAGLERY